MLLFVVAVVVAVVPVVAVVAVVPVVAVLVIVVAVAVVVIASGVAVLVVVLVVVAVVAFVAPVAAVGVVAVAGVNVLDPRPNTEDLRFCIKFEPKSIPNGFQNCFNGLKMSSKLLQKLISSGAIAFLAVCRPPRDHSGFLGGRFLEDFGTQNRSKID